MSVYGGYVGDTGLGGIRIGRSFEGPAAYDAANEPYPLGAWLMTFPHDDSDPSAPLYCAKKTAGYECVFNMYLGVPLETGPNCTSTPCSVGQHLHMADPCVAQGLAGVTGGCE